MNFHNARIRTSDQQNTFLQGIRDCLPTLSGYISIGVSFGVVGSAANVSVLEIACLALFVYAGSAQFIICALLAAKAPMSAIIITTFIVNLRHFLLSLTLAPHLANYSLLKNIGFGALLTDETFGVAINKAAEQGHLYDRWMNGLNLTAYTSWVVSCTAGALLGQRIPDPEALGLDFALVAMFAALLILQLKHIKPETRNHRLFLILLVVVLMILFSFFVPSHIAVLLSTVIAAAVGVVTSK